MKTNEQLQKDVQDAIKWQPLLKAAEVGVTAKDGVVSLTGIVSSFTKKLEAEKAAKGVLGVKAVVEDIHVKFANNIKVNSMSADLVEQEAIEKALSRSWMIDDHNIQVKVKGNKVVLRGAVESLFEKDEATRLAWNAPGVNEVDNELAVVYDF